MVNLICLIVLSILQCLKHMKLDSAGAYNESAASAVSLSTYIEVSINCYLIWKGSGL